jgi:hypothetical protein
MKYFIYTVVAIVTVAVVAGFFIAGSPKEERLRRFDDRRVQDLVQIQNEIINYWTSKGKLPDKLSNLEDSIRGVIIPQDPETDSEYAYRVAGAEIFTLCATFNLEAVNPQRTLDLPRNVKMTLPYYVQGDWDHGAGEICFERTIDKDLYPPKSRNEGTEPIKAVPIY